MRLHTNTLTSRDLYAALGARGMRGVHFYKCDDYGSLTRNRAWEVRLEGSVSNRLLNFGDGHSTAATWDEWGIFLGELFRRDPHMIAGSASSSGWGYRGRADFRLATLRRFDWLQHRDQHQGNHRWRGGNDVSRCRDCSAGMRWTRPPVLVSRVGVHRLDRPTDVERFLAS